jgi:hypothetical protein
VRRRRKGKKPWGAGEEPQHHYNTKPEDNGLRDAEGAVVGGTFMDTDAQAMVDRFASSSSSSSGHKYAGPGPGTKG